MTKKQKILTAVFIAVGAAAMIFFGMRAARSIMKMRGNDSFGKPPPAKQGDVSLIRDWMTIPYVAHAYDVPPDALFKSLGLEKDKAYGKKSLKELNDELYPAQDGIILAHVQAAIQAMQRQEPSPPFPSTPIPATPLATTPTSKP